MRTIKFRVWDGKKMYLPKNETIFKNASFWQVGVSDGETINKEKVEQFSIMQFTELYDKNGKEIYEGDLIEQTNFNGEQYKALYEVVYEGESFCLKMHKGNEKAMSIGGLSCFGHYEDLQLKKGVVIGNIFENPDLVKL